MYFLKLFQVLVSSLFVVDIKHFRLIGAFTVCLTIVSNYDVLTAHSLSSDGADLLYKTAKIGGVHINFMKIWAWWASNRE